MLVVADRLGSPAADRDRLSELVRANREHPTWELLWGSPGTIIAARACGLEDEWRESAELLYARWDEASDMWTGDLYGRRSATSVPATGSPPTCTRFAGSSSEEILRARVTRLLTRTAGRQDGLVNWPPSRRSAERVRATMRVQWCHGAPGIVITLGDLMPLELAVAGGELTWRAGPLKKGPGLCHGTAGNGFAFLVLHDLTGDAVGCTGRAGSRCTRSSRSSASEPRSAAGATRCGRATPGWRCMSRACLDADARFPIMDTV